jgi:cell division protein FtsB
LKLENTSEKDFIAYKVKTTRPQRYCVRPNIGIIPPGETIELQIHFSFHKDPPSSLHCKDKFQVESLVLPSTLSSSEDLPLPELFKSVSTDSIFKQKLKCRFSSPTPTKAGTPAKHADASGKSSKGDEKKGNTENAHEANVAVTALSGAELQHDYTRVSAQLQTVQKERDAAKAQVKELLSQIQQYQEKDIDSSLRRKSREVVRGVKQQAFGLTPFNLIFIFLAALLAFLAGYFHLVEF